MALLSTIFVGFLSLSALISLPLGAYVYLQRTETIGARWLIVIFAGQTVWSLAYALQLLSSQVSWWLLLDRVVATGATVVIAGWLLFVLQYTGYVHRLSSVQLATVLSPFVGGLVTAWTNEYHELFWQLEPAPEVLVGRGGRYLQFEPGLVYVPWLIYLFLVVVALLIVLGATYVRSRSLHRAQVGLLFVAALFPLVGNLLFSAVPAATLAVDITPILFTATNVLLVLALSRYRMVDSVPVSRHALLEQLSDGVVVTDDDTEILHCNQAAREMLGGDLVGESLDDRISLDGIAGDRSSTTDPGFSTTVDGGERHFDVNRIPYTDHRGEQRGAIYVFRDVTALEEHAEALTRQNERLDRFASVVSHDLRNPLSVAMGRLQLAREDTESPHLDEIGQSLERMETLIDDALALAREGEAVTEPEAVDLAALGERCWHTVETAEATLRTDTDGDALIRADPDRLKRLLENLFRNAVEHGGTDVTITVGRCESGFYVQDDGPGIPDGDREDIFDAGFSNSQSGTGFGLSIVSEIVDAHGWAIHVTESPTGGARFEITGVEYAE